MLLTHLIFARCCLDCWRSLCCGRLECQTFRCRFYSCCLFCWATVSCSCFYKMTIAFRTQFSCGNDYGTAFNSIGYTNTIRNNCAVHPVRPEQLKNAFTRFNFSTRYGFTDIPGVPADIAGFKLASYCTDRSKWMWIRNCKWYQHGESLLLQYKIKVKIYFSFLKTVVLSIWFMTIRLRVLYS